MQVDPRCQAILPRMSSRRQPDPGGPAFNEAVDRGGTGTRPVPHRYSAGRAEPRHRRDRVRRRRYRSAIPRRSTSPASMAVIARLTSRPAGAEPAGAAATGSGRRSRASVRAVDIVQNEKQGAIKSFDPGGQRRRQDRRRSRSVRNACEAAVGDVAARQPHGFEQNVLSPPIHCPRDRRTPSRRTSRPPVPLRTTSRQRRFCRIPPVPAQCKTHALTTLSSHLLPTPDPDKIGGEAGQGELAARLSPERSAPLLRRDPASFGSILNPGWMVISSPSICPSWL